MKNNIVVSPEKRYVECPKCNGTCKYKPNYRDLIKRCGNCNKSLYSSPDGKVPEFKCYECGRWTKDFQTTGCENCGHKHDTYEQVKKSYRNIREVEEDATEN